MQNLPLHVAYKILSYLSARDLSRFGLVCKKWRDIENQEIIW